MYLVIRLRSEMTDVIQAIKDDESLFLHYHLNDSWILLIKYWVLLPYRNPKWCYIIPSYIMWCDVAWHRIIICRVIWYPVARCGAMRGARTVVRTAHTLALKRYWSTYILYMTLHDAFGPPNLHPPSSFYWISTLHHITVLGWMNEWKNERKEVRNN